MPLDWDADGGIGTVDAALVIGEQLTALNPVHLEALGPGRDNAVFPAGALEAGAN